jgi:hypothetical protein
VAATSSVWVTVAIRADGPIPKQGRLRYPPARDRSQRTTRPTRTTQEYRGGIQPQDTSEQVISQPANPTEDDNCCPTQAIPKAGHEPGDAGEAPGRPGESSGGSCGQASGGKESELVAPLASGCLLTGGFPSSYTRDMFRHPCGSAPGTIARRIWGRSSPASQPVHPSPGLMEAGTCTRSRSSAAWVSYLTDPRRHDGAIHNARPKLRAGSPSRPGLRGPVRGRGARQVGGSITSVLLSRRVLSDAERTLGVKPSTRPP